MTMEDCDHKIKDMRDTLSNHSDRVDRLEALIAENTAITREIKDILDLGKSFFKIMGYVATFAKWVGYIGTAAITVLTILHLNSPKK